MFGKILEINKNIVKLENKSKKIQSNIINYHVVFELNGTKIVGEITSISEDEINILLVGEIINNKFYSSIKAPDVNSTCRIVYKQELETLIGSQDYKDKSNVLIGDSLLYNGFKVTTSVNDFFNGNFAAIGASGSGKTCGVASILQNMFYYNSTPPKNAHIIIFDTYGEYESSLKKINELNSLNVKNYTTDLNSEFQANEIISIPPYFLDVDDLVILLNVVDSSLIPILEKTIQYVKILNGTNKDVTKYKEAVIAKSILNIIASGKTAEQLSDQIVYILNKFNTPNLNLDTPIVQPGYTRTFKQCLNVDSNGRLGTIPFIIDFLNGFSMPGAIDTEKFNTEYKLEDIADALEFALMSEGMLGADEYKKASDLKVRLNSLINSDESKFFSYNKPYIEKEQFIKGLFLTESTEYVQIININFKYLNTSFSKTLTKIYMKLLLNFVKNLDKRGSFPLNIILEKADRYINDENNLALGYNVFELACKEGSKYGINFGYVVQKVTELSEFCLSECSNFIIFKLIHPNDLKMLSSISPNTLDLDKVKNLPSGSAYLFGTSFKVPLFVKFYLPNPMVTNTNINLEDYWFN
jgi:hypothetical protein